MKTRIYDKLVVPVESRDHFLRQVLARKDILIAMNAKKVVARNKSYRDLINRSTAYPDGMSVVMALAQKGVRTEKYPGVELWLDIVAASYSSRSFYLLGGRCSVVRAAADKLTEQFPGINIVGFRDGYLRDDDIEPLKVELRRKNPDIVLVAMNYQRQDAIMGQLFGAHQALYVGLGGSLDVYTGAARRVPDWWQRAIGSEGLYRLLQDPRKLKRLRPVLTFAFLYYAGRL